MSAEVVIGTEAIILGIACGLRTFARVVTLNVIKGYHHDKDVGESR
jgi:hypothetical protein